MNGEQALQQNAKWNEAVPRTDINLTLAVYCSAVNLNIFN